MTDTPKKHKIKLTTYLEDGTEKEVEWELEEIHIIEERGIVKRYDDDKHCTDISLNGHYRLMIKGWKGCKTWDSFIKEGPA